MTPTSYLRRLWQNIVGRRAVERDLDDELGAYVGLLEAEGVQPRVNLAQIKEEVRDVKVGSYLQAFFQDLRYGVRTLRKSPTFSVIAILALALGIGATTSMFGVVRGVLLSPLPYPQADQLAVVFMHFSPQNAERGNMSMADFLDWKRLNHAFEDPQLMRFTRFDITGGPEPLQVLGAGVTSGFLHTLRVQPLLGRGIAAAEDQPGADHVALIGDALWKRAFSGDPGILGRRLNLNGVPTTVIGIMPADFHFPRSIDELWTNVPLVPPTRRGPFFYRGLARLKPGITWEQAQADANAAGRQIEQENSYYHRLSLPVIPLREALVGKLRPALLALQAAVLVLLLIAAVNVACLLLARSTAREREFALRSSLGAAGGRLIRQLFTESLLLASIGGAAGCLLAYFAIQALRAWNPGNLPRIENIGLDPTVLLFALIVSFATGILFGLAPALHTRADGLSVSLREGGRGGSGSNKRSRLQRFLIVTEMALALVLVTSAGLLMRSFVSLQQVSSGVQTPAGSVLTLNLSASAVQHKEARQYVAFYNSIVERLERLPGVASAAVAESLPPNDLSDYDSFGIYGQQLAPGETNPAIAVNRVTPKYLAVLGIPLQRGRFFAASDTLDSQPVAIVSESTARRFFPNEEAIGKKITQGGPYMEIVGVVADVLYWGLDNESRTSFYQPFSQSSGRREYVIVRAVSGDAAPLAAAIRREIRQVDPDAVVTSVRTLEQSINDSVAQPRFRTALLGVFAFCALLLAAIGLYGVIAYSVSQRTQEIGIRMALGAQRSEVLKQVVRQGLGLGALGALIGLAGSLASTRLLGTLLFHVNATDAITFATGPIVLLAVALVASLIPAYRASRVDPVIALRHE